MKSEFEFLANIKQRFNLSKIGDDCAILPKDSKTDLLVTTDLLVEDIDFRLDWTVPEHLGYKALAVSLSDIAAMGAAPKWAMVSIGIPEKVWKTDFVERFYDGWFTLADRFSVEMVGGDISRSPESIVVDSIAGGEIRKGRSVLRSGANAGDLIFVTGTLGGAAAALALLESGLTLGSFALGSNTENLLLRQLKPDPQTLLGQILGAGIANSMIDVSDGLSSDLLRICAASKKGARLFAERIPFDENIEGNLSENMDVLELALNGGEDFELLFTADPLNSKKILEEISGVKNGKISLIGEITQDPAEFELISQNGVRKLQPLGFEHFTQNDR